jgi:hypothetical protein
LVRSANPSSGNTRIFSLSIRGYDQHVNVTDEAGGSGRACFFALPLGEGEFTSYLNVTENGTWDFWGGGNLNHENTVQIRMYLDNVPYTPAAGEEVFIELAFAE